MSVTAHLFRVGADEPETVRLSEELVRGLDEQQLLWVDIVADPERQQTRSSPPTSCSARWRPGRPGRRDGTSIRFAHETVSLIVPGSVGRRGDAARPVPLHLVAAPNRVVSMHPEALRRLSEPIAVVAADPRFGRLDAGTFLGLLLDGVLDGYFGEVERIERVIDDLDARALGATGPTRS